MTPSAAARPKRAPGQQQAVHGVHLGFGPHELRLAAARREARHGDAWVKPCGQRMAVQPVWFRSSVAWPASRPSMAVRWYWSWELLCRRVRPCVGGRGTNLACSRGKESPRWGSVPAGRPALVPGRGLGRASPARWGLRRMPPGKERRDAASGDGPERLEGKGDGSLCCRRPSEHEDGKPRAEQRMSGAGPVV